MSDESPTDWLAEFMATEKRDPGHSCSCSHDCDNERSAAYQTLETYRQALEVAVEDQIWMSGSADFSPEGIAHEGWIKVRERLNRNLGLLKEIKPPPEGVQA